MFKFWLKCIPLTLGIILSIASTLFLIDFVRGVELELGNFRINSEQILDLIAALFIGSLGVPITVHGIKQIE